MWSDHDDLYIMNVYINLITIKFSTFMGDSILKDVLQGSDES